MQQAKNRDRDFTTEPKYRYNNIYLDCNKTMHLEKAKLDLVYTSSVFIYISC